MAYIVSEKLRGLEWRTARNVAMRAILRMSKYPSTHEEVAVL